MALKASAEAPSSVETGIALAYAYESDEAEQVPKPATKAKVLELLASHPNDPDVRYLEWLVGAGEGAESYVDKLEPESVSDLRILIDVGMDYAARGGRPGKAREENIKRASDFCNRAVMIAPENALALFCRGYIAGMRNNLVEARDFYKKALDREPEFPRARNNLGFAYAGLVDYQNARTEFEAAAMTPGAPIKSKALWLHNLGEAYLELGNNDKACETWRQASQLPRITATYLTEWGLALCAYSEGNLEKARQHYSQAASLGAAQKVDLRKVATVQGWNAGPKELEIAKGLVSGSGQR